MTSDSISNETSSLKPRGSVVKWNLHRTLIVVTMVTLTTCLVLVLWSVLCTNTAENAEVTKSCVDQRQAAVSYTDLRNTIDESFKCRGKSGMVVAVVKDGKTVISEAFGVTLPGSNVNVTRNTRFLISSLTKAFTAALLVDVLANNSRNESYELGTPLRDILGDDFRFADEERTLHASAEDVLSHRIGIPAKGFMRLNPDLKRSDFLYFPRFWNTSFPFRGFSKYSSTSYTLAAAITEKLGGKTWEELAKERLFDPLGMTRTGFAFTTNFSDADVAKPYGSYRKVPIDPLFTRVWNSRCGSGCIVSTVDDMAKWINFILSKGKNAQGHQVFPEERAETLTHVRTYLRTSRRSVIAKPVFPETSVADEYALAWRNGYYKGNKLFSHTGSSPGFASMIMLYPNENMGIFIAMNSDDGAYYYRLALAHYISDYMHGEAPWLNTTTLCSFPRPWMEPQYKPKVTYVTGLKPTLPYIQYIGAYKNDAYGELFINFNQSTFSLQGFYGLGSWQLFPQEEPNNFYGKGMWALDFWNIPGWQFYTADDDPKNITKVSIMGFDANDSPFFYKEFN